MATDRLPTWFQRAENAAIAIAATVAFVHAGFRWWWLPALFLAFDASMIGYLADPRIGAWTYNAVHSYLGPAALAIAAIATDERGAAFLALLWAFHIGVDRALGYGLKFQDRFTHTHLGDLGVGKVVSPPASRTSPPEDRR